MNPQNPKISIGMPVFNGERYIRAALDSLLAQTYMDFELIISDNASTDQTKTICQEYEKDDKRIRYYRQHENIGSTKNFKYVLDMARAEYFMWAAHDDVWDNNWIQILYPISFSNQCLAYGLVNSIDETDTSIIHAANNRRFKFSGAKIIRRVLYYSQAPFLGKANPIYGIFPKRYMTDKVFSTFGKVLGGDMLCLYGLLANIEVIGGAHVYLNKRIRRNFYGSVGKEMPRKSFLLFRLIQVVNDTISLQIKYYIEYTKISSLPERILILLLTPINIFTNIVKLIYNKFKY